MLKEALIGPHRFLVETWERYRRPVAITEAHLGCTREEQLRWLWEVWNAALQARADGADVQAVTIWSLLGSYDWNSLVTVPSGYYEPGAFDVRSPTIRPTALATLATSLAKHIDPRPLFPLLAQPGWWKRNERLIYVSRRPGETPTPPNPTPREYASSEPHRESETVTSTSTSTSTSSVNGSPLLIAGATGTLGRALARICELRGIAYRLLPREEMDITSEHDIHMALDRFQPWAVINAAGYVRVDDAESDRLACYRGNVRGARALATACAAAQLPFLTFSSDLVFDGDRRSPYRESDSVAPLNYYGRAKAVAERQVLRLHSRALIIRTSAFFSPWDHYNFVTVALRTLAAGERFAAAHDAIVSPTFVPDLAHACLDLLIDNESGVWHLANQGATSWAQFARDVAARAGFDRKCIQSRPARWFAWPAARPRYSVLGSERGLLLPPLHDALDGQILSSCRSHPFS